MPDSVQPNNLQPGSADSSNNSAAPSPGQDVPHPSTGTPSSEPTPERRAATTSKRDRRRADAGPPSGLERRRGPGRRLSDFTRAAEEGELNQEQFLFLMAIEGFKKANNKVYPSWTDVLEVVRLLGYRKTLPSELNLRNAEDWQEAPDTPAEVRPKRREAA